MNTRIMKFPYSGILYWALPVKCISFFKKFQFNKCHCNKNFVSVP